MNERQVCRAMGDRYGWGTRQWHKRAGMRHYYVRLGHKIERRMGQREIASQVCEWEWRARDDEQVERSRLDHEQWVADMDAIRYAAWDWEYERMEEDALELGLVA